MRIPFVFISLALLSSCARIEAPSGGPEDLTPPELVSVDPPGGPGNAGTERITITWSERVDPASAGIAVFPRVPHRLSVSGRTVRIELDEPIGRTTLVVQVPYSLSDLRGNPFGAPLAIAFTGLDSLPGGAISAGLSRQGGGQAGESVLLDILSADGTLLRRTSADSTGRVAADWLEPGLYTARCFDDLDRSLEWDPVTEAGAETLVTVGRDTLVLSLVLTVVDTVGPSLQEIEQSDGNHLGVRFSEQIDIPLEPAAAFSVRDSAGGPVRVYGAWTMGGRDFRSILLATEPLPAGTLTLTASGVSDLMGNVTILDSLGFESSDTLPVDSLFVLATYPEAGAQEVPAGGPFSMTFSDWVDLDSLRTRIAMQRVSDGSTVEGILERVTGRAFEFVPWHQLIGGEQYRIDVGSGLVSAGGDTMPSFSWSFISAWGDEPGAIEGVLAGGNHLVLEVVAAGSTSASYSFRIDSEGPYHLEPIAPGRYTVAAYRDANGNGAWDGLGEAYGASPGVVEVRPGLTTDGVDIDVLP